jgi:hypothetical protein
LRNLKKLSEKGVLDVRLSEALLEEAFEQGLIEEPMPLDIAFYLMSQGYIIDQTVTEMEDLYE